ncbi:MAG: MogA/MoaB family molybdenum cofactor biosynthesis protein [Haloquadratum sp.]|jgi:molybdenum cofactor biosynthesis protein B|nr:MogA/MoaB family molybdenum cofactor biosynthesis protein [Haloferacaceae archaeon]MDR9445878.1 MogA/MoaB family molybdenum cofactor biosynthesis protein [Haloquadratum sp.]
MEHHAHDRHDVRVGIITVSSSRGPADDTAGDALEQQATAAGHTVAARTIVADAPAALEAAIVGMGADADAVVTTGGTGITPDDVTIDVVERLIDTPLPGFGELFRARSVAEIGTRAIGTRAVAGVRGRGLLIAVPGSADAARLGGALIMPELGHLVGLRRRPAGDDAV